MTRLHPLRLHTGKLSRPAIREKLLKIITVDEQSGCWNMRGKSYRSIHVGKGIYILAHRLSFWIFRNKGILPYPRNVVMHRCDNPRCINPEHLKLGTQEDNMRDCVAKGRMRQQKTTHCPQGHEYNATNTYYVIERQCRICRYESGKRRYGNRNN